MESIRELPYFMYSLLEELQNGECNSEKLCESWKSPIIQEESENLFQELCNMEESRSNSIQQLCIVLMGCSRYRVDAAIWIHSIELLICKYCN